MRAVLAVVVFACAAVPVAAAPVSKCAGADALRGDPLKHADARAVYEKLVPEPCAASGLAALDALGAAAKQHFDKGSAAAAKKDRAAARVEYLEAIRIEPAFAPAAQALAEIDRADLANAFGGAERLAENGFRAEALLELKKALKSGHAAPAKLVRDIMNPTLWQRGNDWLQANASALLKVAVALIAAIFIWAFGKLWRPQIEISDFKDDPVEAKIGRNLAAMARESLKRFDTSYEPKLALINGPRQSFKLPDDFAKALPPTLSWINIVPSLLAILRPRAVLTIDGVLHPPSTDRGAGLTLTMSRKGDLIHTSTLWQRDFNTTILPASKADPSGYYDLVEPAAIWMLFRMSEEVGA